MPASEYMGWLQYFDAKAKEKSGSSGNLLEMSQDEIIGVVTGD